MGPVQELALFPLEETVVFPGMTIPLLIFEERYKKMIRDHVDQNRRRFVITLIKPSAKISDSQIPIYNVGSFADILSVSENPDGTFNILAHGQGRCKITTTRSETVAEKGGKTSDLLFAEETEYPLARSDPSLEQVAAWDTLETFREYASTFFAPEALEQVEQALPDDLVYQASFICANIRVPAVSRQVMLEAPSLVERFQVSQKLMQERLAAGKSE
ncbi:MAG TPA: LON peptidase substrate-binding domain-containing protein [Trueperaceae bacterium]